MLESRRESEKKRRCLILCLFLSFKLFFPRVQVNGLIIMAFLYILSIFRGWGNSEAFYIAMYLHTSILVSKVSLKIKADVPMFTILTYCMFGSLFLFVINCSKTPL